MSKYERTDAIIRIEGREIPLHHGTYHNKDGGGLDVDRLIERANWCLEHRAEHAAMTAAIKGHRDRLGANFLDYRKLLDRSVEGHQALLDAAGLPAEPEPEALTVTVPADASKVIIDALAATSSALIKLAATIEKGAT